MEEDCKICATCNKLKKLNVDFFYKRKNSKDGFKSSCKSCLSAKSKLFYSENIIAIKEKSKIFRQKNKEKISSYQKKWRSKNKEWIEKYAKSHKKESCERSKKYRDSLSPCKKRKIYEKNLIRSAEWKKSNPLYMSDYCKKYRKENQEKVLSFARNYKARKKQASGSHTGSDVISIIKIQKNMCFWCDSKLDKIHIDHYVPLFRGGSNDKTNLVASCPKCNQSKGSKMPDDFILFKRLKQ